MLSYATCPVWHLSPDTCVGLGSLLTAFRNLLDSMVGLISLALLLLLLMLKACCILAARRLFSSCLIAALLVGSAFRRIPLLFPATSFPPPCAAHFASLSAFLLPFSPSCPGIQRIVMSMLGNLLMSLLCILWISSVRYDPGCADLLECARIDAWLLTTMLTVWRPTLAFLLAHSFSSWYASTCPTLLPSYTMCCFAVPRWYLATLCVIPLRSTAAAPIWPSIPDPSVYTGIPCISY